MGILYLHKDHKCFTCATKFKFLEMLREDCLIWRLIYLKPGNTECVKRATLNKANEESLPCFLDLPRFNYNPSPYALS